MVMNEDYCDYKLSLALKACGFDEPCQMYYTHEDAPDCALWLTGDPRDPENYNKAHDDCPFARPTCSAPTLAHAQKWLREKKGIDALVYNCACGYTWEVSKANNGTGLILFDEKGDDENSGCWTSYEGALSASIAAALELIKKGE